jgi:hypothetical protein
VWSDIVYIAGAIIVMQNGNEGLIVLVMILGFLAI